jgi:hypothetical protein
MPPGVPVPSNEHVLGIMPQHGGAKNAAKTTVSEKVQGMAGMGGMPSDYDAVLEELAAQGGPPTALTRRGAAAGTWPGTCPEPGQECG